MRIRLERENINTVERFNADKEAYQAGIPSITTRLKRELSEMKEFDRWLDVGCANGEFVKLYKEKYPNSHAHGLDIADEVLSLAENIDGDFRVGDVYDLPYPDERFDMVHCSQVLEHLEFPEMAIFQMWRVLKPNGTLFLTTTNENDTDAEEHLWRWDIDGVARMFTGFKIINENPSFIYDILSIEAIKL